MMEFGSLTQNDYGQKDEIDPVQDILEDYDTKLNSIKFKLKI